MPYWVQQIFQNSDNINCWEGRRTTTKYSKGMRVFKRVQHLRRGIRQHAREAPVLLSAYEPQGSTCPQRLEDIWSLKHEKYKNTVEMTEMTTKRRIHKCPRNAPIKRNFINHFTWTSKREGEGHIPKTSLVVTSHTSCPLLNTEVSRF